MSQTLLSLALIGVASSAVLSAAAWAGISSRHWFLRASVVAAALLALYPIQALEPIVWLSAVVPPTAWLASRLRRPSEEAASLPREGLRFRLINLFLVMVLAGVMSAVGAGIWRESLELDWRLGLLAALCGMLVLLCTWLVGSRGRWRLAAVAALAAGLVGAAAVCSWFLPRSVPFEEISYASVPMRLAGAAALCACCALTTLLLAMLTQANASGSLGARIARAACGAALLAILVPSGIVYTRMLQGRQPPPNTYGSENSFDEAMELIAMALSPTPDASRLAALGLESAGLRTRTQRLCLEVLARLDTPGHVPFDIRQDGRASYFEEMLVEVQSMRSFARMLDGNAIGATMGARPDEASRFALGNMQLGATLARGGICIHSLLGIAVEGIGAHALKRVRDEVPLARATELIKQLERLRAAREPAAVTMARDAAYSDRAFRWGVRLQNAAAWLLSGEEVEPGISTAFHSAVLRRDAMLELLIAELAVRLHLAKHGRPPSSWEDLVPAFATEVPRDPYSGKPVVLRLIDGEPVLYCVGADGRDDGGRFGSYSDLLAPQGGFDYDVDVGDR